ncbi:DUF192 domain-containing protein [Romeriopsis navalis]|uniref:DUF192 domain-containing protein n=1 Tax=Romeriopsis navalis TaxID=2992132 RepID=UPI0021F86CF5|nr:DUF192 domain-containing protein [Romeriopsis navalis]
MTIRSRPQLAALLLACLSLGLLGCSEAQAPANPTTNNPPPIISSTVVNDAPQTLPFEITATINQIQFKIAVANTPRQQQIGLMLRSNLPDDEGMLFPFSPARRVGFWMKNTLIPLDMLYIRDGIIREIKHNVPPCKTDPCPTYPSEELIDQVIEIRGGLAKAVGIKVGDRVQLETINPKS